MLNFERVGHGLPMEIVVDHLLTGGGPDGMDASRPSLSRWYVATNRAWTGIHAAIVDLLAGRLPATDRR
jgi:hypothetical protein